MADLDQQVRYEALSRLGEAIRSNQGDDLFSILAAALRQIVRLHTIGHYNALRHTMNWRVEDSVPHADPILGLPLEQTVVAWAHQNQQAVVIPSVAAETRFPESMEILKQVGIGSLCAIPLATAHRRLGGLVFASRQESVFPPDEVRFLRMATDQIALAMDDGLNFREAQRTAERLELLLGLTNSVVSTLDLRDLLREIVASIRRVMHCEGTGVALPDPETGDLRVYAIDFPSSKGVLQEGIIFDSSTTAAGVFRSGRGKILTTEEIVGQPLSHAEGARSLAHFPIIGRAGTLGVITIGSVRENAFSNDDAVFLSRVATQIAIAIENALAFGQIAALKDQLAQEKVYLEDEIRSELHFEEIIGTSEGLRQVLRQIETVAPTDSTVLIYGETGTGKELIARAVHNLSTRHANAFVKLNCAAIPTGLLESELFGHEKGAFTGAIAQRVGRFELANKGTIFLDEVGEIPLELQPKLLRVLQEREFERLGSSRTMRTDARLIAATNRDLKAMADEGRFRADLYYRLNVFPVRVPALRERPEDIPLLVRHFVQQFSRRGGKTIDSIPSETMEALVRYLWPGNIRELQNVIERAVILSRSSVLKVPVSDLKVPASTLPVSRSNSSGENLREELGMQERTRILEALEQSQWVVAGPHGAAERLGMKRSTLQFRMRKLGIRVSRQGL
jgi:formate hydrogenlyase transcriptional activator